MAYRLPSHRQNNNVRNWRVVMYLIYLALVIIASATIVVYLGGFPGLIDFAGNASGLLTVLARFFALFGVSLLAVQITTGAFSRFFERVYGISLRSWHMRQGIIVYLLIVVHPILTLLNLLIAPTGFTTDRPGVLSILLSSVAQTEENHPQSVTVILIGVLTVAVLTVGTMTATGTGRSMIGSQWRKLHVLNYLTFVLDSTHVLLIGEFTLAFPFLALYPVLLGAVVLSFLYRRFWSRASLS